MTCDLCATLSGRFIADRECCELRQLAEAPQHVRRAAYQRARTEGGAAAEKALKDKVRAEYLRQQQVRAGWEKQRLEAQRVKGKAAVGALLEAMKEHGMNLPPLERAAKGAA